MNPEFRHAFVPGMDIEWLAWLGQPMLYDGGLCVNRSEEDHNETNKHKALLIV